MDKPTVVVCVYKKMDGGDFSTEYVKRLYEGSIKNGANEFLCLTDDETIDFCPVKKLEDNLPGWWSKLELFKLPPDRQYLYMDLDSIILKDLSCILRYKHKFTMISNFGNLSEPASGVMAWSGNHKYLYDEFIKNKEEFMNEYTIPEKWGDQGFIRDHLRNPPERFDKILSKDCSNITSYKLSNHEDQLKSAIVCFHWKPRPHEIDWNIEYQYSKPAKQSYMQRVKLKPRGMK